MIVAVVGTRPEVVKIAPVLAALRARNVPVRLVTTGQHTHWEMMGAFLETFGLEADHAVALSRRDLLGSLVEIMSGLDTLLRELRPEIVLAVGDTTTVLASALAARKMGAAFGHIESGLRAFSRELPEEEHRICADALADLLFAPTRIAIENLARERVNGRVILTGNTVLDALLAHPPPLSAERRGILVTLHRQETVDDPDKLAQVLAALDTLSVAYDVVWPLHPRTVAKARDAGLAFPPAIDCCQPLGHPQFLAKLATARLVITDSGGVQEESAILGTPCVTVRNHTERPETIAEGVGVLVRVDTREILGAVYHVLAHHAQFARPAPHLYGDGRAGAKIAQACIEWLEAKSAVLQRSAG